MNWILLAIASAFTFGIVSILDKVILMRYMRNARTFIVMVGVMQFVMSAPVLAFAPAWSYSPDLLVVGYISGALQGLALVTMFWAMSTQDVSRVVPVASTFPVFVAILAMIFLSENLSALHWTAILVTVSGAAIISLRTHGRTGRPALNSSFFLLLFGSMAFGGGQFLTKVVLEDVDLWSLFVVRNAGLGTVCIALMFRPGILSDIRRRMADPMTVTVFVATEGVLVFVALVFTLWAISLGPVSLVVTVMSTRPLFVFALSVLLSSSIWQLLDEPLDRKTLANKLVSTAMIVAGISTISLL